MSKKQAEVQEELPPEPEVVEDETPPEPEVVETEAPVTVPVGGNEPGQLPPSAQ